MREISESEAEKRFPALLADVQRGQAYVITRDGVPVATLVPPDGDDGVRAERRASIERTFVELARTRLGVTLDIPLKQAIEDGRD